MPAQHKSSRIWTRMCSKPEEWWKHWLIKNHSNYKPSYFDIYLYSSLCKRKKQNGNAYQTQLLATPCGKFMGKIDLVSLAFAMYVEKKRELRKDICLREQQSCSRNIPLCCHSVCWLSCNLNRLLLQHTSSGFEVTQCKVIGYKQIVGLRLWSSVAYTRQDLRGLCN